MTTSQLSLERLKELQSECLADDVEIDLESMRLWSEEKARTFFENGGSHKAPMSKQSILDILEGKPPEEPPPDAAAAEGGAEPGRDGDLPPDEAGEEAAPKARALPDIHKTLGGQSKEDAEEEARPKYELPVPDAEVMTVDEAYEFLGISTEERGDLNVLKARFRKLCFKYHPDKNRGREEAAARSFQAVHAAYHFLTTMNFDYKRWKKAFNVPPQRSNPRHRRRRPARGTARPVLRQSGAADAHGRMRALPPRGRCRHCSRSRRS
jgi:hypothetical protein